MAVLAEQGLKREKRAIVAAAVLSAGWSGVGRAGRAGTQLSGQQQSPGAFKEFGVSAGLPVGVWETAAGTTIEGAASRDARRGAGMHAMNQGSDERAGIFGMRDDV
ncbi:hypothetical protein L7F22_020601 [Adiantum nelumboides]|nr:hypothetical protein [Adiantum nelumboides]